MTHELVERLRKPWDGSPGSRKRRDEERAEAADLIEALERENDALRAENAELREALKPFAAVADLVDSETEGVADSDEFQMHFHDYLMASWKLSIFRRARALLSKESAEQDGSATSSKGQADG